MIKSKWTLISLLGQFFMPVLLIVLLAAFYPFFLSRNAVSLFSTIGIMALFITVIVPVYMIAQMKISYKKVNIDTELKTIAFKMYLLPIIKTYSLDEFDGYVEAIMKRDYYAGIYKCYYLVKYNKLQYKMSGRFYSNIDELYKGISYMPYLGSVNYTLGLSIQIALGNEVLTDS